MPLLNYSLLVLAALLVGFASETVYRKRRSSDGSLYSRKYAVTEMAFLAVTVWAVLAAPIATLYHTVLLGWCLVMLARIDIERFILPDVLNFAVFVLGASLLLNATDDVRIDRLLGAAIGFGLFLGLDWLYRRYRGRSGLGRGDAKLMGALGIWVGALSLPAVILIASGTAIIFILFWSARARTRVDRETPVAFGPALAFAGWVVWLYGPIGL